MGNELSLRLFCCVSEDAAAAVAARDARARNPPLDARTDDEADLYLYDIFISHAESAAELAERLRAELELIRPGLRVAVSSDVTREAGDAASTIQSARCFAFLITRDVLRSEAALREALEAARSRRRIVVVWDRQKLPTFPIVHSSTAVPATDGLAPAQTRRVLQRILVLQAVQFFRDRDRREAALREILDRADRATPFLYDPTSEGADSTPAGSDRPPSEADRLSAASASQSLWSASQAGGEPPPLPEVDDVVADPRGPPHGLPTIGEAVRAASALQRVLVAPGRYRERLLLDRDVRVVGSPGAVLDGGDEGPALHCAGGAAPSVTGLAIRCRGARLPAVLVTAGSRPVLEACDVKAAGLAGVEARGLGVAPLLLRCVVHHCRGAGVHVSDGASATIDGCEVHRCTGPGVWLEACGEAAVRSCTVHSGRAAGVVCDRSPAAVVEACEVRGNALAGVELAGEACEAIVRGNKIHDGLGPGVLAHRGSHGTVESNEIDGNAGAGVRVESGATPLVRLNKLRGGLGPGIAVIDGGRGLFESNEVVESAGPGVLVESGGDPYIKANRVRGGRSYGIAVQARGRGTIQDNDISENALAGVVIQADGECAVVANLIHSQAAGIDVNWGARGSVQRNTLEGIADPAYRSCRGVRVQPQATTAVRDNRFRASAGPKLSRPLLSLSFGGSRHSKN